MSLMTQMNHMTQIMFMVYIYHMDDNIFYEWKQQYWQNWHGWKKYYMDENTKLWWNFTTLMKNDHCSYLEVYCDVTHTYLPFSSTYVKPPSTFPTK